MRQPEAARRATAVITSLAASRARRGSAAFQRAVICGTELRPGITAEHVSRVFSLTGLDRLVPIYPSLEAATAVGPPTEMLAVVAGPGLGGSRSRGGSTVGYGR
jgi:hypothetical protein